MYDWKNLDLRSITTITIIITFIQFAIIPLDKAKNELGSVFIKSDTTTVTRAFLAPIDFIDAFYRISVPMRVLVFAVLVIALMNLVILSLFFPIKRIFIYLGDLICSMMAFFGYMFIYHNYTSHIGFGWFFAIVGISYLILRIFFAVFPSFSGQKSSKWSQYLSKRITAVFLSRISKSETKEDLDEETNRIRNRIKEEEASIDFNNYSEENKDKDFLYSCILFGSLLLLYLIGWNNIVYPFYKGNQLSDIDTLLSSISIILLIAFAFRLFCAYLMKYKDYKSKFIWMKRWGFKGVIILISLTLLPVIDMILRSTDVEPVACGFGEYYDYQNNQTSFLAYFMDRPNVGCTNCSKKSYSLKDCEERCSYNYSYFNKVTTNARYISEDEMTKVYTIPITILQVFFLLVLTQLQKSLFERSLDIVSVLPAPTSNTETKFSSILSKIRSTGGYIFSSYRLDQAMFHFTFTQWKMFVLFFSSLFPIFPVTSLREEASWIITLIFTITCIAISIAHLFLEPYKSKLHNLLNVVSYLVGTFASFIAFWAIKQKDNNSKDSMIGDIVYFSVFAVPIFTVLVLPFFLSFDPVFKPVKYDITEIMKKDKVVSQMKPGKKRRRLSMTSSGSGSIMESEHSESHELTEEGEKERIKSLTERSLPDFDTLKLAPIHIQQGRDAKVKEFEAKVRHVWGFHEVNQYSLECATEELFETTDMLLDTTSYNDLLSLLSISNIIVSICLGWGLGSGVCNWKSLTPNTSLKCDI